MLSPSKWSFDRFLPGWTPPKTWLNESTVEAAFRCIADERELTKPNLVQLDAKAGEWEPLRKLPRMMIHLPETSIYSCWRRGSSHTASTKIDVLALPCQWSEDLVPVEDGMYEQTMYSAGLHGPLGLGFCPTW